MVIARLAAEQADAAEAAVEKKPVGQLQWRTVELLPEARYGIYMAVGMTIWAWTTETLRRVWPGLNALMMRHGRGRWCLVVDPDEFLVYPHMDSRDLKMLTEHLDAAGRPSLGTLLLDLYGDGPVAKTTCGPGDDPIKAAPWFDPANYFIRRNDRTGRKEYRQSLAEQADEKQ